MVTSAWSNPQESEQNISWTRALFAALRPYLAPGAYVNYFGGDEGVDPDALVREKRKPAKINPTMLYRKSAWTYRASL